MSTKPDLRADTLSAIYTTMYYGGAKEDSPLKSRTNLAKRLIELLKTSSEDEILLNLGSGPQLFEKEFRQRVSQSPEPNIRALSSTRMISLDIAAIPKHRLLDSASTPHIRADSAHIPLSDEAAGIVISNLSLDMLRTGGAKYRSALQEVHRVLKVGGYFLANFHPYDLYKHNCAYVDAGDQDASYFDADAPNPFYRVPMEIVNDFQDAGLDVCGIGVASDGRDSWWEIDAVRSVLSTHL